MTLEDPIEMGVSMEELGPKLLQNEYYQILFKKAFFSGNSPIGIEAYDPKNVSSDITTALEAFINSIGVFDTRYDEGVILNGLGDRDYSNFSDAENLGKRLFNDNCASCHNLGRAFSTQVAVADNGLDMNYSDLGVGEVLGLPTQNGVFKVPMLRNVALTAPYMHDGRFKNLEEVIEHYSTGIKNSPNLHNDLKQANGEVRRLNLDNTEKEALLAFLHTLTDNTSISKARYADPFK